MRLFSSWLVTSKFLPMCSLPCTAMLIMPKRRLSSQRRRRNTPRQPSRRQRARPPSLLPPQTPPNRSRPPRAIHPNPPHNPRPPPRNPLPQPNLPPNHQRPPPAVPRPISPPRSHTRTKAHGRLAHYNPQHRRLMARPTLRHEAVSRRGAAGPERQVAVY